MPSRLAPHVPSLPALALYVVTLVLEVPSILARMLVMLAVSALVLLLAGHTASGAWTFARTLHPPDTVGGLRTFTPHR